MNRRAVRPIRARAGVACLALTAGLVLAGCSEMSPQTTQLQYAASDGVRGQSGTLGVRNLLLVAHDGGTDATLVGTLVNSGQNDPLQVTIATSESVGPIEVRPGGSLDLSSGQELVVPIDTRPGLLQKVTISGGDHSFELNAPVLDGTLPEYKTLLPTASPTAGTSGTSQLPGQESPTAGVTAPPNASTGTPTNN